MGCKPCFFIMASGTGSNAEKLAEVALENQWELKGLICDREKAPVLEKMERLGVRYWVVPFPHKEEGVLLERRKAHCDLVVELISELVNPEEEIWLFLAGYQRLLSPEFLQKFFDKDLRVNRVINIHPSLLPLFPGRDGYGEAYRAQVNESGCTVHFVDEGMDTGPIIVQMKFQCNPKDSLEEFKAQGLALEHKVYPRVLKAVMSKQFYLDKELNFFFTEESR